MKMKKLKNLNKNKKFPDVFLAENFKERLIGLMGRKNINFGLIIPQCNSIHTFFMKEEIEVVFLNKKNKVVRIIRNMKPWRMTRLHFKASKVLELPKNTLTDNFITLGEQVEFSEL